MKKGSKRVTAAALALLMASSAAAGSLFDSPAELLAEDAGSAIVLAADDDAPAGGDEAGGEADGEESRRRGGGLRASLRQRVLRLPLAVRLLVVLPLWGIGSAVLSLAGAAWTLLAPYLSRVGGFALLLALLGLGFAAGAKAVFPDLPLKKLLSRRSLALLALCAAGLTAGDAVLAAVWKDYGPVRSAVLSGGFFLALCAALLPFALKEQRRRLRKAEKERADAERAEAERRARQPLIFTDGVQSYTVRR